MPGATDRPQPVSVVIPTYNGEGYIEEALQSVLAQTQLPNEIIVVDDASTDGTVPRVARVADHAPVRIRLVQLPRNSGSPARPLNVGLEAASSPLIAVLDQDDVFLPQKIERQASVLSNHPRVAFVFSHFDAQATPHVPRRRVTPAARVRYLREQMTRGGQVAVCDGDIALRVLLNRGNCIGGFPGFTFRRDDWRALGRIDERLVAAADYDLLARLCTRGRAALIPEVHYLFRFHAGNLSRSALLCHADEIETLVKFRDCRAWPAAPAEVRRAISERLYRLAVLCGSGGIARVGWRLLASSLRVNRLGGRSLLRAANYPIKVRRQRKQGGRAPIGPRELRRAVDCVQLMARLRDRDGAQRTADEHAGETRQNEWRYSNRAS